MKSKNKNDTMSIYPENVILSVLPLYQFLKASLVSTSFKFKKTYWNTFCSYKSWCNLFSLVFKMRVYLAHPTSVLKGGILLTFLIARQRSSIDALFSLWSHCNCLSGTHENYNNLLKREAITQFFYSLLNYKIYKV